MKAKITIKMDNAAFCESEGEQTTESTGAELARILRDLAEHIEDGNTGCVLMDSNGNRIGTFSIEE